MIASRRLLTLLASLLLIGALAQQVQLERQVFDIGRKLRCPVCVSESVADSAAQIAVEMRDIIQQQLQEGRSEKEILAFFQERYGDWILLDPPKRGLHLLVWILPVVAAVAGAALLAVFVRRWLRSSGAALEVDEADLERVREALDRESP